MKTASQTPKEKQVGTHRSRNRHGEPSEHDASLMTIKETPR